MIAELLLLFGGANVAKLMAEANEEYRQRQERKKLRSPSMREYAMLAETPTTGETIWTQQK